jgi:hypothetical protein
MIDLDQFVAEYIRAMLWADLEGPGDSGGGDPTMTPGRLAPEATARCRADCAKFLADHAAEVELALEHQDAGRIAHDLWLTRQGHGSGFWDGDYPDDLGERLTRAAKAMGEAYPEVGDDGRVYV